MNRKMVYIISCIMLGILLSGCAVSENADSRKANSRNIELSGVTEEIAEETNTASLRAKKVGVAMPTSSSERWVNDGANMKAKLEALGYEVDLQCAEDDIQTQVEQIGNMILNGADCLVIASIDSEALINVLSRAKRNGIPVVAYDRLLMNTDAVSYYATFDNTDVGTMIGTYIEEEKNLKEASKRGESYTIEFFMGSPDDNNALFLYNGVMQVLKPYLDDGTLVCKSGQTSFEDTCILRWSQAAAQERCSQYLEEYYTDEKLDIACSAFDGFSYGIKTALLDHGYEAGQDWPVITGQDAEKTAIQNIMEGSQTMTVYKDTRILSTKCVTMVQAVLEGVTPEINEREDYHNGKMIVPSYLCNSVAVDQDNYEEILIDGGYYTRVQLMK